MPSALAQPAPDARTARSEPFGIPCFAGDMSEAAELVCERARARRGGYACLANSHVFVTAQRKPQVRTALARAWGVFPDGWPVAWLQRRLGTPGAERVAGPDLMLEVLRLGCESGLRHFLFGSTADVVERMEERLRCLIPGLDIAGALAPAAGEEDGEEVLDQLRGAKADIVWVALGAPKQELWALRHAESLAPALVIGVGAAFDFHAGVKPRAPLWMQNAGLEWLHRLISEPRRLGWRYLSTNSRFLVYAARELAR